MKKMIGLSLILVIPFILCFLLLYPFSYDSPAASIALTSETYLPEWEEDPAFLFEGQQHYAFRCGKCHDSTGRGSIKGPNLVDDQWILGTGSQSDIYRIIKNGTPNGKMKGWKKKLLPYHMHAIAYYLVSLNQTKAP